MQKDMWPISDKIPSSRRPKSPWAKEFERRYKEHLATLPPERTKLFETEDDPPWNGPLGHDLIRTVARFKDDFANNPKVEQVHPGLSSSIKYVFIAVVLKPGVEPKTCGLPEFYQGYWVVPEPHGLRT